MNNNNTNRMKIIIFLTGLLFLSGCSQTDCRFSLSPMSDDLTEYLISLMDEEGVQYQIDKNKLICVSAVDAQSKLPSIMERVANKFLPKDRSISANHYLHEIYKLRFREREIQFKEYQLEEGFIFLVWSAEDTKLVREIIEVEVEKYLIMKKQEDRDLETFFKSNGSAE